MSQPLHPKSSLGTYDSLIVVILRTRRGEGLGIGMRDDVGGVLVYEVHRGQQAHGLIREGDRVISVGGRPVRTAVRAAKLMSSGKRVTIRIQRPNSLHAVGSAEDEQRAAEQSVEDYIARAARDDDDDDYQYITMADISRDAASLTTGAAGTSAAGAASCSPIHEAGGPDMGLDLRLAQASRPKGKGKARAV